jgi:hypothetical protein
MNEDKGYTALTTVRGAIDVSAAKGHCNAVCEECGRPPYDPATATYSPPTGVFLKGRKSYPTS